MTVKQIQKQLTNRYVCILLTVCAFILYANVLSGPFLFDDISLVENNTFVHSLHNITEYFSPEVRDRVAGTSNMYRPFSRFIYSLTYVAGGGSPWAFHFVNILIHIMSSCIVFLLLKQIKFSHIMSVALACIYLAHPTQVESVSYISGLPDVLSGMCVLATVYLSVRVFHTQRYTYIAGAVCAFFGAVFAKESGIVAAPLSILVYLYFLYGDRKTHFKRTQVVHCILLTLLMVIYLYIRLVVIDYGNISLSVGNSRYNSSIVSRIITHLHYLLEYVRLLFFPVDLHFDKQFANHGLLTQQALVGAAVVCSLIYVAVESFFKKGMAWLGLVWVAVAFVPMSGIIPMNAPYFEHWLYVPLVGVLIALGSGWSTLYDKLSNKKPQYIMRKTTGSLLIIALILFGWRVIQRNKEWADPILFYQNELKYTPKSSRVLNNMGATYSADNQLEKAIEFYQKAVDASVDAPPEQRARYHFNIGNIYLRQERYEDALGKYKDAIAIYPALRPAYIRIIEVLTTTGDVKNAERLQSLLTRSDSGEEMTMDIVLEVLNDI